MIGSTLSRQRDSLPASTIKDGVINGKDAEKFKVPSVHPQPPPVKCQFCQKTLYHEGIYVFGHIPCWSPFPERCTCREAKAFWKKEDELSAKKKAEEEQLEKEKQKQKKSEEFLLNSGIGKRFLQRTFEAYECFSAEQKKVYRITKRFADTFSERLKDGKGLYIEGTNGTGKTHLAAAIALQLVGECRKVVFRTYGKLLEEIEKAIHGRDSEDSKKYELSKLYQDCDLLVIDDLGKERCSDWSVSFLFGVINDRYENLMPTIITTNYDSESLIKALTPSNTKDNQKAKAIVSRLRGSNLLITMSWDDYRTEKHE